MKFTKTKKPDATTPNSSADEWTGSIGEDGERDLIGQKEYGFWSSSTSDKHWIHFRHSSCSGTQRSRFCDSETMDCGGRSMVRFGGVVKGSKCFVCLCWFCSPSLHFPRRLPFPPNSDHPSSTSPSLGSQFITQSMSTTDTPFTILTTEPARNPNIHRQDGFPKYDGVEAAIAERPMTPSLSHRLKHDKSILALVVSKQCIFAGTEDGEILVWSSCVFCKLRD
jgi:hypothetical protein